jgi:hypothetical protein
VTTTWTGRCGSSSCIEVAPAPDGGVLIRSASTLPGEEVHATAAEWWQHLDAVKTGALDDVVPRPVSA